MGFDLMIQDLESFRNYLMSKSKVIKDWADLYIYAILIKF